jgi:hypothetical protein
MMLRRNVFYFSVELLSRLLMLLLSHFLKLAYLAICLGECALRLGSRLLGRLNILSEVLATCN